MNFKFKRLYHRVFSIFLVIVLSVLSVPTSAVAKEGNEEPLNISTSAPISDSTIATDLSQEVIWPVVSDEEAMRREQLIQNGYSPDDYSASEYKQMAARGELQPLAVYPAVLADGVYAIKNIGNSSGSTGFYLDTALAHWLPGYNMQQYKFTNGGSPLDNFSTSALFKITRNPSTGSYIIRIMRNNALSFGIRLNFDGSTEILSKKIPLDDSSVALTDTYSITVSGSGYKICKYGTTNLIATKETTASGAAGAPNSYLYASTAIGDQTRWTFSAYTGPERSEMTMLGSGSLEVAKTSPLDPVFYSSRPGYNVLSLIMSQIPTSYYTLSGPSDYGIYSLTPHQGTAWTVGIFLKNGTSANASSILVKLETWNIALPIDEGMYFFENAEFPGKYMQIDDDSSSSTNGAIMELWDFDGDDDQRWELDHISDGKYKILSVESGKALTAPSSVNGSVTQKTYTGATNQLWYITANTNGSYALTNSTYYLAAGDGIFTSDGRNVEGRAEQSDAKDEWNLRLLPYAYSIGGEFHNGNDVISANNNWTQCGYISSYSINPSINSLNYNNLNSKVVYFSTHGSQHGLTLLNNISFTDGLIAANANTIEVNNFSLPDAKLYIYDACLTASNGDGSGRNLCTETIISGVDCVIGWTKNIFINDALKWQEKFQSKLISGASVIAAANYANTFAYSNNDAIKSWRIYGNQNLIINEHIVTISENSEDADNLKLVNIAYPQHSSIAIETILSSNFSSFTNDIASVKIVYTNSSQTNYVIDYYYQMDDFSTGSGYSIVVENGVITQMRDNTIAPGNGVRTYETASSPTVTQAVVDSAISQALSEINSINDKYVVVEHSGDKFYDIETGRYFYRVMTTYITPENTFGGIITFYEL